MSRIILHRRHLRQVPALISSYGLVSLVNRGVGLI